jgi:hypothetical protein
MSELEAVIQVSEQGAGFNIESVCIYLQLYIIYIMRIRIWVRGNHSGSTIWFNRKFRIVTKFMVLVLGYAFTLLSDGYRVLSVGRWIMGFGITPSEKARTIGSARFLDGQLIPNKYFCTTI